MTNLQKLKTKKNSGKLLTVEDQILDPIKTMARNVLGDTAKIPKVKITKPKLR